MYWIFVKDFVYWVRYGVLEKKRRGKRELVGVTGRGGLDAGSRFAGLGLTGRKIQLVHKNVSKPPKFAEGLAVI